MRPTSQAPSRLTSLSWSEMWIIFSLNCQSNGMSVMSTYKIQSNNWAHQCNTSSTVLCENLELPYMFCFSNTINRHSVHAKHFKNIYFSVSFFVSSHFWICCSNGVVMASHARGKLVTNKALTGRLSLPEVALRCNCNRGFKMSCWYCASPVTVYLVRNMFWVCLKSSLNVLFYFIRAMNSSSCTVACQQGLRSVQLLSSPFHFWYQHVRVGTRTSLTLPR